VRQQQKAAIVDQQGQPSAALLFRPANPSIARAQTPGGGAKDQHPQPIPLRRSDGVEKLLAHGANIPQIMVSGQQPTGSPFSLGRRKQLDLHLSQKDGSAGLSRTKSLIHAHNMKNSASKVQHNALTYISSITSLSG
jgi:hypothetical protein